MLCISIFKKKILSNFQRLFYAPPLVRGNERSDRGIFWSFNLYPSGSLHSPPPFPKGGSILSSWASAKNPFYYPFGKGEGAKRQGDILKIQLISLRLTSFATSLSKGRLYLVILSVSEGSYMFYPKKIPWLLLFKSLFI